jgi:integrase
VAKVVSKAQNTRKPWTVRYWADGKQRERSFVTRRDADDYAAKVEHDKRAAIVADPRLGDAPFRDYAAAWLRQHGGAANTIRIYGNALDLHVNPVIGDTSLRKITREQLRELLTETLPAKPVSHSVLVTVKMVLTSVLGEAARSKRISENPVAGIRLPGAQAPVSFYVPTRGELEKLATGMPAVWQLTIWLMRGCGLRVGEALAVGKASPRGGALRLTEQVLERTQAFAPLKHRKPGEFRDVPLPEWVAEKIAAHVNDHGTADDGHLFARRNVHNLRYAFMAAAKAAGLTPEFTPHDLRHVWASITLARGVPVTDVSRYLGHRSVDLTYRLYSRFIPSSFDTARKILDEEWRSA